MHLSSLGPFFFPQLIDKANSEAHCSFLQKKKSPVTYRVPEHPLDQTGVCHGHVMDDKPTDSGSLPTYRASILPWDPIRYSNDGCSRLILCF